MNIWIIQKKNLKFRILKEIISMFEKYLPIPFITKKSLWYKWFGLFPEFIVIRQYIICFTYYLRQFN